MTECAPGLPPSLSLLLGELNINVTFGTLVIGAFVIGSLYGITTVQTYIYFNYISQVDGTALRCLVSHVFMTWKRGRVFDTLETVFSGHLAYHYLVNWFSDPQTLTKFVCGLSSVFSRSAGAHVMIGAIGDAIIAGLLAYRILVLRLTRSQVEGRRWPLAVIVPPAIYSFSLGILSLAIPDIKNMQARAGSLITVVTLFCTNTAPVYFAELIARTNDIVNVLLYFMINTCLLTSSVAIAALLTWIIWPDSYVWMTLTAISPKLMLNSVLALLNSRDALKGRLAGASLARTPIHLNRFDPVLHIRPLSSDENHAQAAHSEIEFAHKTIQSELAQAAKNTHGSPLTVLGTSLNEYVFVPDEKHVTIDNTIYGPISQQTEEPRYVITAGNVTGRRRQWWRTHPTALSTQAVLKKLYEIASYQRHVYLSDIARWLSTVQDHKSTLGPENPSGRDLYVFGVRWNRERRDGSYTKEMHAAGLLIV
ncbi:hypothetical protein BDW22DRAFT_1346386 [Trametopsis cervina]|nr:hypothetical protein BDW22DRAFT_1346386 [Trametopsis cervina]